MNGSAQSTITLPKDVRKVAVENVAVSDVTPSVTCVRGVGTSSQEVAVCSVGDTTTSKRTADVMKDDVISTPAKKMKKSG